MSEEPRPHETLGQFIKRRREGQSWTQDKLAEASGVSIHTIRNYEHGNREPTLLHAYKVACALGIDLTVFARLIEVERSIQIPDTTGERIDHYQLSANLTDQQLAKAAKITLKRLKELKNGSALHHPEGNHLAKALGVNPNKL